MAPGEKTEYPFIVFAGPKYHERSRGDSRRAARTPSWPTLVDVTFAVLSRPMLALLKQFYRLTGNWGIAIILLTIVVRLVTFYPTHRTLVSAKKMQGLSDKIAALRKKYENDKQKLGVETMNLYKAHGVSPFGGCLPSLIQMPIWIALFSTLNYAVELYHSSFFWYITDLSAKDPYYLAPLLMGSVMFVQMRMSPAGTDPQQQKMMAIMMPVMFTGFSLFLPAGLSIYTLTSYLIGILQQLYVNRRYRLPPADRCPPRRRTRAPAFGMPAGRHAHSPARQPAARRTSCRSRSSRSCLPAGPAGRGRAGLGRGAVPRGARGRGARRAATSAWRSGASWWSRRTGAASELGLAQVRSVFANISVDLPRLFAPASVTPLLRQLSRSVVQAAAAQAPRGERGAGRRSSMPLLAPDGEIHVATDIFDIALDAMAALEGRPGRFATCASPGASCAQSRFAARSRRERHCEEAGHQDLAARPIAGT